GSPVRQRAIRNALPAVGADGGGACACATCHVHVDEAWRATVGNPSPMEEDMLDFGYDVRPNSRLSCQIKVTAELEGLVVRTPERQAYRSCVSAPSRRGTSSHIRAATSLKFGERV